MDFQQSVRFRVPPSLEVDQFFNGDTTPSVEHGTVFKCGTSIVTITNFDKGQDNHTIRILGNINTTIANNSTIKTNTGVDKTLQSNKIYTFTYINNVWYENE